MVDIWGTTHEEIEKAFRGHLPQECIMILARMNEEGRMLQSAVNAQEARINKMMQFIVLHEEYKSMLQADKDKFDKTFDDPYRDIINNEDKKN